MLEVVERFDEQASHVAVVHRVEDLASLSACSYDTLIAQARQVVRNG